jgi:DNA-binding transcriptional ArsR family regulator
MRAIKPKNTKSTIEPGSQRQNRDKVAPWAKTMKPASTFLKMVSDPTRLFILRTLSDCDHGIGQLCRAIGQSQPAVSYHLALLRQRGLIHFRREGNQNVYLLTDKGRRIACLIRKLISPTIDSSLLEDVGGFVDDPEEWFRTSNVEFEGRKPIELLGTADEPRLRNRIEAAKLGLFS